jgi:hypothetical protein
VSIATSPLSFGLPLLNRVVCPHCWERFAPEDVLWVSEHLELQGDPLLGPTHAQRFLPSRFNLAGDAIDAKGQACRVLACPRCHLTIARGLLELEPLLVSILGAPASGKSYFLASATWTLRQVLPNAFNVSFQDADPLENAILSQAEERLFLNPEPERLFPLRELIDKTVLEGDTYDSVSFGQQTVRYPRPYLFSLQARPRDRIPAGSDRLSYMLYLYDNAGEHFQPGQDTASQPVTRHLALSRVLLFVFDPTQDQRLRSAAYAEGPSLAVEAGRVSRQETILSEAAARIRRYSGLSQSESLKSPLIVVVSKLDAWGHLLGYDLSSEPWKASPDGWIAGLNVERILGVSADVRSLLLTYCPEIVATAESLAKDVTYVPVSALGRQIEPLPDSGKPAIRPARIQPSWVTVPFLFGLSQVVTGFIPRLVRRDKSSKSSSGSVPADRPRGGSLGAEPTGR